MPVVAAPAGATSRLPVPDRLCAARGPRAGSVGENGTNLVIGAAFTDKVRVPCSRRVSLAAGPRSSRVQLTVQVTDLPVPRTSACG